MTSSGEQGSFRPAGSFVRRERKPDELRGVLEEAAPWPGASVSDFPQTLYRRTRSGKDESILPEVWKARLTIRARDWPAGQRSFSTSHDRFVVDVAVFPCDQVLTMGKTLTANLKANPRPIRHLERNAAKARWVV